MRDEFTVHPCDYRPSAPYFNFRHGGWAHLRETVYDAMEEAGMKIGALQRFACCGDEARLYRHASTGEVCIMGNFCRQRNCIPCGNAKSKVIAGNLRDFIRDKRVRFLTLTIKHHGDEALSFLIDRCWKSFKLLRRRPQWDANVKGFAAFMETKWSARDSGWHVHLHVLCEGRWWDQKEISHLWHACTGDSYIVDIQAKGTPEGMAYYAAKYVCKPLNPADVVSRCRLVEAIKATAGRHLYLVGGTWKGHLHLNARPPISADWDDIGSADALWSDAAGGSAPAKVLIDMIEHRVKVNHPSHQQPPP